MPAYQLHIYGQQEEREVLEQKICEQVEACTEVNGKIQNRVKKFLIEEEISDVSEMDAVLRIRYEAYLKENETVHAPITCLRGFDRIVIHRMKEEMQTLAGQRKYSTEYCDQWLCLTHYPEVEIAESFLASKDGKELMWDFTLECPRNLKMQIFTVLKEVIHIYQGWTRKEKLLALQRFYQFCVKNQVADIETMTLEEEQKFRYELSGNFTGKKKNAVFGIIRMSRKILFLQASEIHWKANMWFLERFHFSKERMNPSTPVEWISFKEVTKLENQEILQRYLRYLFGITDLSISTIRIKLLELRTFLVHFNGEEKPIHEMEAEKIKAYLKRIQNQNTRETTANGRIFMILQFYNFLVVKGYLKRIPFRHEYYLQKEINVHNDRSVPEKVYVEILSKLVYFPEHLRLMFLHLWCVGLRGSEVCTLTGSDYEEKNGDYWLKVYQVKMKTYKRIRTLLINIGKQILIQRNRVKDIEELVSKPNLSMFHNFLCNNNGTGLILLYADNGVGNCLLSLKLELLSGGIKPSRRNIKGILAANRSRRFRRFRVRNYEMKRLFTRGGDGTANFDKKCLVIGCGSIGSYASKAIIDIGITDNITLLDKDTLNVENLARHLCSSQYLWLPEQKSEALKLELLKHYPAMKCNAIKGNAWEYILNNCSMLNQFDLILICVGNTVIEKKIIQLIKEKAINRESIILWVEPYMVAGHALIFQKEIDESTEKSIYDTNGMFNKNILIDSGKYLKSEAGCQSAYAPYAGFEAQKFVLDFWDVYYRKIYSQKKKYNYEFTWIGKMKWARQQKFNIKPEWRAKDDRFMELKRIDNQ